MHRRVPSARRPRCRRDVRRFPSIGYCERAWTKYQRRPHRRKYAGDGWLSDVEADETTASARLQGGLHVGNGAEIPARRFTDSGRTYPEAVSVHAPHTEALFIIGAQQRSTSWLLTGHKT